MIDTNQTMSIMILHVHVLNTRKIIKLDSKSKRGPNRLSIRNKFKNTDRLKLKKCERIYHANKNKNKNWKQVHQLQTKLSSEQGKLFKDKDGENTVMKGSIL